MEATFLSFWMKLPVFLMIIFVLMIFYYLYRLLSGFTVEKSHRVLEVKDYLNKKGQLTCPCCGHGVVGHPAKAGVQCSKCNALIFTKGEVLIVLNSSVEAATRF